MTYDRQSPFVLAKNKFYKKKLSVAGFIIIIFFIAISIFGYLIMLDNSPGANTMNMEISAKKPGFSCDFLAVRKNRDIKNYGLIHRLFFGQNPKYTFIAINSYKFVKDSIYINPYTEDKDQPIFLSAYNIADVIYTVDNTKNITVKKDSCIFRDIYQIPHKKSIASLQNEIVKKHIKTRTYFLGTDIYGRDMLSRMILGSRVSLAVSFVSAFMSLLLGILLGSLAGYYGGITDGIVSWFMNVIWALPSLLLAIAISFALGKGFWQVFIAIAASMWVDVARIVRGQIMSIKETNFIEAGKALGFKSGRIIFRHILPNISGPVLVVLSASFASAILLEAGLSFLGFGAQPPFPSWGSMIKDHYGYIIMDAAYMAMVPGFAIMALVYAFNLVSIGLSDAFNIRNT